jgi:hypothetical protein
MSDRSELQKAVVDALVESQAINFEAVGSVMAKFGARAALNGEAIGMIINRKFLDLCIPVDFKDLLRGVDIQQINAQGKV